MAGDGMTPEEAKDIAAILQAVQPKQSNVVELFIKIFAGLVIMLMGGALIWIMASLSALSTAMATVNARMDAYGSSITELKQFAQGPRFTQNEFNSGILPLQQAITRNTQDIEDMRRTSRMQDWRKNKGDS